jgi:hypothetical protein
MVPSDLKQLAGAISEVRRLMEPLTADETEELGTVRRGVRAGGMGRARVD